MSDKFNKNLVSIIEALYPDEDKQWKEVVNFFNPCADMLMEWGKGLSDPKIVPDITIIDEIATALGELISNLKELDKWIGSSELPPIWFGFRENVRDMLKQYKDLKIVARIRTYTRWLNKTNSMSNLSADDLVDFENLCVEVGDFILELADMMHDAIESASTARRKPKASNDSRRAS